MLGIFPDHKLTCTPLKSSLATNDKVTTPLVRYQVEEALFCKDTPVKVGSSLSIVNSEVSETTSQERSTILAIYQLKKREYDQVYVHVYT